VKTWLISDTHFNHEAMVALAGRPQNHTDLTIRNWIKLVAPEDLVIHLGDVIFSRASELTEIMGKLPGRKIVTVGNHDRSAAWLMGHGVDFACEGFKLNGVYYTHEPQFVLPEGCDFVVHGHLHESTHHDYPEPIPSYNRLFALEREKYRPVLLKEFLLRELVQERLGR
jgi:calcineurin-like phosphoesterase family protein